MPFMSFSCSSIICSSIIVCHVKHLRHATLISITAIPHITIATFDPQPSYSNLTCISTGSPATTVTWTLTDGLTLTMRDGDSMTSNMVNYQQTQTVTGRHNSTYMNVLIINTTSVGKITEYKCTVINILGNDSKYIESKSK